MFLKQNECATTHSPCATKKERQRLVRVELERDLGGHSEKYKNVFICTRCVKSVGFFHFNMTRNFDERSIILDEFDPQSRKCQVRWSPNLRKVETVSF